MTYGLFLVGCTCAYALIRLIMDWKFGRGPQTTAEWMAPSKGAYKRALKQVMDDAEREWEQHGRDDVNRILF